MHHNKTGCVKDRYFGKIVRTILDITAFADLRPIRKRGVAPGACSRLIFACQYRRGSVFKFAQFAPGACPRIFNRLNIVEHFAGWKFCSRRRSIPMKSRSVPPEHAPRAKSFVCIGLKGCKLVWLFLMILKNLFTLDNGTLFSNV